MQSEQYNIIMQTKYDLWNYEIVLIVHVQKIKWAYLWIIVIYNCVTRFT